MDLDPKTLNEMEAFVAQSCFGAAQACAMEAGRSADDRETVALLVTHGAARAMSGMILANSCAAGKPKPDALLAKELLNKFLDLVYAGLKHAETSGWYGRQLEESRKDGAGMERMLH